MNCICWKADLEIVRSSKINGVGGKGGEMLQALMMTAMIYWTFSKSKNVIQSDENIRIYKNYLKKKKKCIFM